MYTSYDNGFTEALLRNLTDARFDAFTATIQYDTAAVPIGRELRFAWPGSYRTTVVSHTNRGVLLVDELHVPLATELAAAMQRLEDIEGIVRANLPPSIRETEALATGVVVYADRWDVVPNDPRIALVVSEEQPERTLQPLFDRVLSAIADPDEVDEIAESIAAQWVVTERADVMPPIVRDVA